MEEVTNCYFAYELPGKKKKKKEKREGSFMSVLDGF
jgi:hypothetical protein